MSWHSADLYACVIVCVSVVFGQWGDAGVCPAGLKGMQVAQSAICHATILGQCLTTCSVQFQTPARTHTNTHMAAHGCTQTHRSLEGRDEISSSSVFHWDLKTQTWRPWPYIWPHDPGTRMPTCLQICTNAHTHTRTLMSLFLFFSSSKATLCLIFSKCAYLNITALN